MIKIKNTYCISKSFVTNNISDLQLLLNFCEKIVIRLKLILVCWAITTSNLFNSTGVGNEHTEPPSVSVDGRGNHRNIPVTRWHQSRLGNVVGIASVRDFDVELRKVDQAGSKSAGNYILVNSIKICLHIVFACASLIPFYFHVAL